MANNKAGIQGPSDLGSGSSGDRSNPAYKNPDPQLDKSQATGAIGGYKVFCKPGEYQGGKGANIQGVSATDLAAEPGPGSSKGLSNSHKS
jgi:hypothetical protein